MIPTMPDQQHTSRFYRRFFSLVLRALLTLAQGILALACLWQALQFTARPDPLDTLRRGDALFIAGRYHDARATYSQLVAQDSRLARGYLRQGMVAAIRGEFEVASRSLARAVGMGLQGEDRDLARLYQGYVALQLGHADEAVATWQAVDPRSTLLPVRRVLEGERLLHAGDYATAEATFRSVNLDEVPPAWQAIVRNRLAALRAASDPQSALALLQQPGGNMSGTLAPSSAVFVAPLLPSGGPNTEALAAALRADPGYRPALLGQVYLEGKLYALAEAQFSAAAADNAYARSAAAYAAYTRWLAGDRATGRQQLEALVAAHPDEPSARALLALTLLADAKAQPAQAQLATMQKLAPQAPDTHLAWAQWYAATSDYIAATNEYERAVREAPLAERGVYALAQAQFHVETEVQVCETGQPVAEEAAQLLPNNVAAWTTLAAARFRCSNPAGAREAARQALKLDPTSAEASYYLGRALAALGDRPGARNALVSAADLAPDSAWRERAETQLGVLGL
jgi:predicted Zn-dependent protease